MPRPSVLLAAIGLAPLVAACSGARCCPTASPCRPAPLAVKLPAPPAAPATPAAPAVPGSAAAPATPAVPATAAAPAIGGPDDWDALLRKYVKGDYVDYAAWKANPADLRRLDAFLAWQAQADAKSMSREDAIAFYINAYNSTNVKMVLDNYPVHSPMDVPGYFDKVKHRVAGEDLTVSEIEYDRLIANYQDMRAHFAVVCSDRGCLPLRAGAWKGATLDEDLDAAARRFASDERHFKVDPAKKEVWISKIFEWYGPKFTADPKRPVAKAELYLLPYVSPEARKLLESGDYTLKIIEWNWTINEKRS